MNQRPLTRTELACLILAAHRECERLDNAEEWARKYNKGRYWKDAGALAGYYLNRIAKGAAREFWKQKQ